MKTSLEQSVPPQASNSEWTPAQGAGSRTTESLCGRLTAGTSRAAVTFAGQGVEVFDELATLIESSPAARALVRQVSEVTRRWPAVLDFARAGAFDQGFDPWLWATSPAARPERGYLASSPVSQPAILLCQAARWASSLDLGLRAAVASGGIVAATGHSQGIMAAVLAAETGAGVVALDRVVEMLEWMAWQGVHMAASYRRLGGEAPTATRSAMASVAGLDRTRLESILSEVCGGLEGAERPVIALENARTRFVLSGPPARLDEVREGLEALAAREAAAKKAGRFAGQVAEVQWAYLDVAAAYHSPAMATGHAAMRATAHARGFRVDASAFAFPVVSVSEGTVWDRAAGDITEALLSSMFVERVRWSTAVTVASNLRGADAVVDCGPGDGVALLTRSVLRGTGRRVFALARADERQAFFDEPYEPRGERQPIRYADFAPARATRPDGRPWVDNRFSRGTGTPPVFLAGMTPTTSDTPIVVAAANAGFTAELAGGGQVSERIFWRRMEAMAEALEPGRGFVFNALFLDPYLWDLHIRKAGLVKKARRQGFPIDGVTISAGIPEVEDAVALLDDLAGLGMRVNAFKPGTLAQIEQVVRIARAAPAHTVYVHLEGGKAGGHHSWEDLDALLLAGYAMLRDRPNVVVCAGGGIGTPTAAIERLNGSWARRHGLEPMPVDAVFLGTRVMACLEACTSDAVKDALVDANGTGDWVFNGEVHGGVTSGKSSLNADIWYLENDAARAGRLLDAVAGDAEAVERRRDEIIAALEKTSKPYFGDLERMTYAQAVRRLVTLLAVGRGGPYEDGPFPDPSYRTRVADFLRLCERRLAVGRGAPVESVVPGLEALDAPEAVLQRFETTYPDAALERVHPDDARAFVRDICDRPGKPVCFVAALDADVRRRFKADSLWQAHDDRWPASQVFAIPGPEAVGGIRVKNEPVAEVLQAFVDGLVDTLPESAEAPTASVVAPVDAALAVDLHGVTVVSECAPDTLRLYLRATYGGALAAFLGAAEIFVAHRHTRSPVVALLASTVGARVDCEADADGHLRRCVLRPAVGGEQLDLSLEREGPREVVRLDLRLTRATLTQRFVAVEGTGGLTFVGLDPEPGSVTNFYHHALFGESLTAAAPLTEAREVCSLSAREIEDYRLQTDAGALGHMPLPMAFSLVWRPLMRVLSAPAYGAALLRLLHRSVRIVPGPAWPVAADQALEVVSRAVRVTRTDAGMSLETRSEAFRHGQGVVCVEATFVLRGAETVDEHDAPVVERTWDTVDFDVTVPDAGALAFLRGLPGVSLEAEVRAGDTVRWSGERNDRVDVDGRSAWSARGQLAVAGRTVGQFDLQDTCPSGAPRGEAPLDALRAVLATPEGHGADTPSRALGETAWRLPGNMLGFALASRDLNPIHTSTLVARLAGLDGVIVHGMYSAGRLHASLVRSAAGGHESRVRRFAVDFEAPAYPGESARIAVRSVGVTGGVLRCVAELRVQRALSQDEVVVARASAEVLPPRTAYVFPGQGIQRKGMGMEGYARSRAARALWDRADAYTRAEFGFSILSIVRENPVASVIDGEARLHPQGLLNSTELTQVAMTVLAHAQVAELREAGAFVEDAVACGHSIGEYNAISAVTQVLPLEAVIAIVYARGCTMHRMVPRDASGESGYRMGVIRPNLAGLDHAAAEALVAEIERETGQFLEIVNFNVRGRQYSVTGQVGALDALERALAARARIQGKAPYVEVPGIDVPFHSRALRDGVPGFRAVLDARLPPEIDAQRLVHRYVPNLVGRPFELTRDFVESVVAKTGSPVLMDVLARFEMQKPDVLARTLLLELLAWQFASPVRWIDSQEVLEAPRAEGGLEVERVIEVGVGYQPTLVGMAKQSLGAHVQVLHVEVDRERVFALDADADVAGLVEAAETAPSGPLVAPVLVAAPVFSGAPSASAAPVPDRPFGPADAARVVLAWQARVRPEQLRAEAGRDETIDELFGGVSSRRNQVLLDLGAELGTGAVDGAHERPLSTLLPELAKRATGFNGPGRYLRVHADEAFKRVFGRAALSRSELHTRLEGTYGLGPGLRDHFAVSLALESREGASTRGGVLGGLAGKVATRASEVEALLDEHVGALGQRLGLTLGRRVEHTAATAVDSAALNALDARIFGPQGALTGLSLDLAERLRALADAPQTDAVADPRDDLAVRFEALVAELGPEWEAATRGTFDAHKHVVFAAAWASAQRDVARLALLDAGAEVSTLVAEVERLAPWTSDARVRDTARWYAGCARVAGKPRVADALDRLAVERAPTGLAVPTLRPVCTVGADGALELREVPRDTPASPTPFVGFAGRTMLVTGASPGSIALEAVRHLLRGGARVYVTTSTYSAARLRTYREVYEAAAGPGAELHVVPFNQASLRDVDALVDWLAAEVTEPTGGGVRVLKRPDHIDVVLPFAAMKDGGTVDTLDTRSDVALRANLVAVERLVARFARLARIRGVGHRPTHVVLPLSPNVGGFGGDGTYAESKTGLEALLRKHTSEHDAWGHALTLAAARIGWVRGTGLMDQNDALAAGLEASAGVRTSSAAEMGARIAALCTDEVRRQARTAPVLADLTDGLADVAAVKPVIDAVRTRLESQVRERKRQQALTEAFGARTRPRRPAVLVEPLVPLDASVVVSPRAYGAFPRPQGATLEDTVVVVGYGELGPYGGARTRFEYETDGALSPAGVLELAWTTGLVRWDDSGRGTWVDTETNAPVAEADLVSRYGEAVMKRVGIRVIEPAVAGFDPEALTTYTTVLLDRDFSFEVTTEAEARSFEAADPKHTRVAVSPSGEGWRVTRTAGAELRLPRRIRLSRNVAGQLPTGFDPVRAGVPADLAESVDRLTLFNLVATADAFLSAGLTPEELLRWVHPARVGNAQGAGIGGMRSLRRLYVDVVLDRERQTDALQETLINVLAGYVVQSYVGSYGPMVHPVAACATAAVSLEVAADLIRGGKADFVVAGGYDDLGSEGAQGFSDMNATADTDEMRGMGLEPGQMSRANDLRRRGFVEAQGGGTLLLARADVAAKMGLPVLGVLAYAGSFSDGVQRSVPAPGLGVVAAGMGGATSPLGSALVRHGLTADDVAVVYKHDTSTAANDPNENRVHETLQRVLGRTLGNPLWVVSQKTLTGHSKGGAAAWQAIGLCQTLSSGRVPGNRNLDCVDPYMRSFEHLGFTNKTLPLGRLHDLRAGLLTSLGFGHVGGIALMLHPAAFEALLPTETLADYREARVARETTRNRAWYDILRGRRALFERRGHRRFHAADGSAAQTAEELEMLLSAEARLDPTGARFVRPRAEDRS
jgi:3-oxoacyl-ACP reductase-like protein/enoyl reductase-like protein/3-oxoacyl-(acyl-carrier-protein) synthase